MPFGFMPGSRSPFAAHWRDMGNWPSGNGKTEKSGYRMAAEKNPFSRRWHGGMIFTNQAVIREISDKSSGRPSAGGAGLRAEEPCSSSATTSSIRRGVTTAMTSGASPPRSRAPTSSPCRKSNAIGRAPPWPTSRPSSAPCCPATTGSMARPSTWTPARSRPTARWSTAAASSATCCWRVGRWTGRGSTSCPNSRPSRRSTWMHRHWRLSSMRRAGRCGCCRSISAPSRTAIG